jgi:hypothetical protein
MIAVYQRCLANYQSRQWDMGAHVMFNATLKENMLVKPPSLPCYALGSLEYGYACLSDCLLAAANQVSNNGACLNMWLQKRGVNSLDFFEYSEIKVALPPSHEIHACKVFSGPAQIAGSVGLPFRVCLDNYDDTGICHLPHIVWSGRSTNKVSVGVDHSTIITDPTQKLTAARLAYQSIMDNVRQALDNMQDWDGSNLKVSIFSAEGDLLHQYFDCLMLGALDDVDIWPGPDVAKPVWSRSRSGAPTREFELPCSGDALKSRDGTRDSRSPFTCGSDARRAAIKYFLRNGDNSNNNNNQNLVREAVQALLVKLRAAWITDDLNRYMCQCPDGTHGVGCCVLDRSCDPSTTKCACGGDLPASYACCEIECTDNTFLPPSFQVAFTSIKGSDMLSGLFDSVWMYVNSTMWTNNDPWLLYDEGGAEAYNWTLNNLQSPVDHGLFDTTAAISAYDASELGYPFKTNVWSMCHGLLQQVHFTMPLRNGRPTTLNDPYDPDGASTTANMTYREDFVRRLVGDAYKHSPLFWHYHARHKPSQSAMCRRSTPRWPNSVNQTYFAHGYASMTIGGHAVDCYCGWWFNSTHCQIPDSVCERLVQIIGSSQVQDACASGGFADNTFIMDVMPQLIKLEGGWRGWPCPAMHISDHWGILQDQTAWLKGGRSLAGVDEFILINGTSGLRRGSLPWLLGAHIEHINPAARVQSVQPLQCDLSPPQSVVDSFVDDLFPAAQGVRQSGAVSSCMRFSIEVARMSAYQEANLVVAAADQGAVVATWRRRCEMKLRQVAFCQVYGVYNVFASAGECPFHITSSATAAYSVTPACLVIYDGKVYDPCLCNAALCLANAELNVVILTNCQIFQYHVRDMVLDRVTNRVPWPATSNTSIPRPLARSSFMADILQTIKAPIVANNKAHWATSEGEDASHYCDLVVDWWPDSWRHPVGYHVTLPCKDAAHRTFDAAWAALREGTQVSMMHVPNALRNRTMQTNQFGAAGACRTHNYGMPTKIMNSMRFCTQADNRPADPTVPGISDTADWGVEYCTTSPFQVPWTNGPPSVGTYFNYLVDLLPFASWDDKSGHAPFKSCTDDIHCCSDCKCLASTTGGICAKMQTGTFECAQHQHCTEKLCAGDGVCVQGVLEVHNDAAFDMSARVYAERCTAGANADDTWGMSKEDTVPDILSSSGMCSYRSWFEHRRLTGCTSTQCTLDGSSPWRFSSPDTQPAAAFDAGVLAVHAHVCDRDYEHMTNMNSCSPTGSQALLRNQFGETQPYQRATRTKTYRSDKKLPIVRHAHLDNLGAGFLGIDKTYAQLGYGTMQAPGTSKLQSCSRFGLCSDQAASQMWYVNGLMEAKRMVTEPDGTTRAYNSTDMQLCGSMGFKDGAVCRIDPAVVPLFYEFCSSGTAAPPCTTYIGGVYPQKSRLQDIADNLNSLFATRKLGVAQWTEYLTAVDAAQHIWDNIRARSWTSVDGLQWAKVLHTYGGASPKGLYFLMTYGAYELPFAWWWRCGWLSGLAVTASITPCEAWSENSLNRPTPTEFDVYPEPIGGKTQGRKGRLQSIPWLKWVAKADGVFTRTTVAEARRAAHETFINVVSALDIPDIPFACYQEAARQPGWNTESYLAKVYSLGASDSQWTSGVPGVCSGFAECLKHTKRTTVNKFLVRDVISMLKQTTTCAESPSCECIRSMNPTTCSFATDELSETIATDSNYLPLFAVRGGNNIPTTDYGASMDGCNVVHCCTGFANCYSPRSVNTCACASSTLMSSELDLAGISSLQPQTPAWIVFSDGAKPTTISSDKYLAQGSNWFAVDVCKASGKGPTMRCTLADPATTWTFPTVSDQKAKTIQDSYRTQYPVDPLTQQCIYQKTSAGLNCLDGKLIAGKTIYIPDNSKVTAQAFNVPLKACYRLACTGAMRQYHGKVVFDTADYLVQMKVTLNVRQVQFDYTNRNVVHVIGGSATKTYETSSDVFKSRQLVIDAYVSKGSGAAEKVISFISPACYYDPSSKFTPLCTQNTKLSRSMSADYNIPGTASLISKLFPAMTKDDMQTLIKDIVKATEDAFTTNTDYQFQSNTNGCTDRIPQTMQSCQVPNTRLTYVRECPQADIIAEIQKNKATLCTAYASDQTGDGIWRKDKYCNQKFKEGTDTDFILHTPEKYDCINFQFEYVIPNVCTAAPIEEKCTYNSTYEQNFTDAGLPPVGFCPDCVGPSCENTKSSATYNLVDGAYNLHQIAPTLIIATSYKLTGIASHFSMSLGMLKNNQMQCGPPTCASNQRAVELYRNMFVCIACKTVPPVFCSGDHMCSFQKWNWEGAKTLSGYARYADVFANDNTTYEQAFAAVTWAAEAVLANTFTTPVGVLPKWVDFLEENTFGNYNPSILKETFNQNIEDLKGYCDKDSILPQFGECQNDEPRRTLRSFVESQYKVPEGSMIPAKHTLSWFVDQNQLLHTNIPAWHVTSPSSFFKTLFDDSVCEKGTIANLLCYSDTDVTMALNPVLAGRFEVSEGCDVVGSARVIDSLCSAQVCPNTQGIADEYNTFADLPTIGNPNTQMRCKSQAGRIAQYMSVADESSVNLCTKRPAQPTRCLAQQGMLGHSSWDGAAVTSVYSRGAWPDSVLPSGLLSGLNPLLRFELLTSSTVGNLALDPWDIGGHYIRMTMRPSGVFAVSALPLRSYASLATATALTSTDWVSAWRTAIPTETASMMDQFALRTCMSWDCPLRRRAFWTAQHPTFRPFSPNPFRSRQLYGTNTHPTTRPAPLPNGLLSRYQTRNGFCACPVGDSCLPVSGDCSAADTIASLTDLSGPGLRARAAKVLQEPCAQQMDWPWTGGTMRDSSVLRNSASACGVLDRLPDFLYRYHDSQTVLPSDTTTLDDGGDCHMGRPATYNASVDTCTLVRKTDDAMVVNCDGINVTLQRPKSPNITVNTRTRCESCDPLPVFKAADGTVLGEPEVSYGKLWRWAPARKLAQDLRFRLCGNATTCPPLRQQTLAGFWPQMMAGGLTGTATDGTVAKLFQAVSEDDADDARWLTPWMLCTNNGSGVDCQGSASKRDWLVDRKGTCDLIAKMPNSDQAVANLTVCNLDSRLDYLCRVIQNARYQLFEANCKLSGACRTSAFFYQPATYSISNDEFVRQTVQYFYKFAVPDSCPVYDQELQAILDQNEVTAQHCSAQSLQVMQFAIQMARQVIHRLVKMVFFSMQIGMDLVGLISAPDPGPIIKSVMATLAMVLAEFLEFFKIMGDLMYKMIMETGQLGRFIRDMVVKVCEFLRDVFDKALKPLVCFIKETIMTILYAFEKVVEFFNGFCVGGCNNGNFIKDVEKTRQRLADTFNCDMPNPFNCSKIFADDGGGPTHLPMPTRCWVGFKPSIGEQRGLGCSASDTCMDDDGSLTACAACTGDVDMLRFGCDSLTKLCRCHTFPIGRTECSSHLECQLPDTECGFVDAYLQPSFGNVPCARCSNKAICLKTGSIGQCTCLLRETPTQMCPVQYHAQRVSPDPTQLCLVSLGLGNSQNNQYSANWQDLASSPCALLNVAQTYCLTVYLQNGGYSYMAVGLALLSRRRLLSIEAFQQNLTEWEHAHEPCRSLMQAEHLTVLEEHFASECERWRLVGERAIVMFNLSARPVQFTSYLGMAEASISPQAYVFLFQHADWAQPIFVMGRRYWHFIAPLLNATRRLFRKSATPEVFIHQAQELLPWFAAPMPKPVEEPMANATANTTVANTTRSRRLLSWKDDLQAVHRYSVQIAKGNIANLAPDLAGQWNKGPFLWPPNYNYWEREQPCLLGSLMWNFTYLTMQSTAAYYTHTGPARPPVARTLRQALPSFEGMQEKAVNFEPSLVAFVKSLLKQVLGFDVSCIKRYISSPDGGKTSSQLSQDFMDLIQCDFEKVQHCTGQRRSLLWGGVIVAIFLVTVSVILRTIGVPMADVFLLMAFVPLTLLFVFNYSITCVPLVPTCMLAEILDLLETLLPSSISWPTQLQRWPGCVNGSVALTSRGTVDYALMGDIKPATAQCFRECTEWPFNYRTWEDNAQWIACEIGFCSAEFITKNYQPWVELLPLPAYIYELVHMDRYVSAAKIKPFYLQWDDMKQSQRVCCAFTVFNVIPPLLLSVVILVALFAVLSIVAALVHASVNTVAALLAYTHAR